MATYFMLLTSIGAAKMAAHLAGGGAPPLQIVSLAVGDGAGAPVAPTESRVDLVQEVHRQGLTNLSVHGDNANWVVAETILAPTVGGWWIREVGLIDIDGDLVAYGNFPESYKPVLSEGSGKELIIRPILEVSSTAAITLIVDSSILWATQAWVLGQGFATQAWVAAQGYATQAWVKALLKRLRPFRYYNSNH